MRKFAKRVMQQCAELDHAVPELRDESPSLSPSPNHHPPSTSPSIFPSKQRWNSLQEALRFAGLMLGIEGETGT